MVIPYLYGSAAVLQKTFRLLERYFTDMPSPHHQCQSTGGNKLNAHSLS